MTAGIVSKIPQGGVGLTRIECGKGVMAAQALLVVVVVRDAGLRSALAAHLSLDGHDLLTASSTGHGLLDSGMIRAPAIVVIDAALIPLDAERWIERRRAAGAWLGLGVLAESGQPSGDEWYRRIAPHSASREVPKWAAAFARPAGPA